MKITSLFKGKFLHFVHREGWEYVERTNASGVVAIAAVTDAGCLVLTEQLRPPLNAAVIELPAGLAGDKPEASDEELVEAARRELWEETGYEADVLEQVAVGPVSAGISTEVMTCYLARGLRKTGPGGGDATESIIVHEVPLPEIRTWLAACEARGCYVDLKVYTGLYFLNASNRQEG